MVVVENLAGGRPECQRALGSRDWEYCGTPRWSLRFGIVGVDMSVLISLVLDWFGR
jgi:hypothetical protein